MERDSNPRTFYRLTVFKTVLLTRLEYPSIKALGHYPYHVIVAAT